MGSSNNLVLLILLLTVSLMLVVEASQERREIPSEEEKKDLERQLKAINKPALKSFKTKQGVIYDCIDIHKQLAFDHPLLKNHSVQLKPTALPEWITYKNISQKVGPFQLLPKGISCPDGTVIVKRTTMQDLLNAQHLKSVGFNSPRHGPTKGNNTDYTGHHFATADYSYNSFSGAKGKLNLWDVQVSQDQVSLATMAVAAGTDENLASISVGWMVNPVLYKDHVHLYTYWTADGYKKTGCYDLRCPGFVQVSKIIPLGVLVQPVSIYDGAQYDLDLSLVQDVHLHRGDWWFIFGGESVGYWPGSLFRGGSSANRAHYASWGGQVYSPLTEKTPVMGSGHFPNEGYKKAAYINDIQVIDGSGKAFIPHVYSIKPHESTPNCYKSQYIHDDEDPWRRAIFYGGPGGCTGQ